MATNLVVISRTRTTNSTATGFEVTKISATTATTNMEAIRTPTASLVEGNMEVPATVEEAEDKTITTVTTRTSIPIQ